MLLSISKRLNSFNNKCLSQYQIKESFRIFSLSYKGDINNNETLSRNQRQSKEVGRMLASLDNGIESLDEKRDMVDLTAVKTSMDAKTRNKLNRSLETPVKKVIDKVSKGLLDATADEIADDMNEYLRKFPLFNEEPGSPHSFASLSRITMLEICQVNLNRDRSHAHAQWRSIPVELFLRELYLDIKNSPTKQSVYQKILVAEKIERNINKALVSKEGKFRSHIIKSINFRRVPRIFFEANSEIKTLISRLKDAYSLF